MLDRLTEWWQRKFFRVVVHIAFGLTLFVFFLFLTFPQHRVTQIISVQAESALNHQYNVSIEQMRFWRLTGVQMRGVRLQERPQGGAANDGMAMTVQIDRVSARFAPLRSLLNRALTVRYHVDMGGGIVRGDVALRGSQAEITSRFDGLDLRRTTLLASMLRISMIGSLDGRISLVADLNQGTITNGSINLRGRNIILPATVVQVEQIPILTNLDLPTTRFGELLVEIEIEEGDGRFSRMEFKEFRAHGQTDIQFELWGSIDMLHGGGTRPDLQMRMQVGQEYITENNLSFLFNMREFRTGQRGEWYGFTVAGRTGNINFQGSTAAAQGREAQAAPAQGQPNGADPREDGEE